MTKEKKAVEEFRQRLIEILSAGLELSYKIYAVQNPNKEYNDRFLAYINGVKNSIEAIKEME